MRRFERFAVAGFLVAFSAIGLVAEAFGQGSPNRPPPRAPVRTFVPNYSMPSVTRPNRLPNVGKPSRTGNQSEKTASPPPKDDAPKRPPIWFVSLMTGSDNENNFDYMGQIYARGNYGHGKKARINNDAPAARAFAWFWNMVNANREDLFDNAAVWHEGRCGQEHRRRHDRPR